MAEDIRWQQRFSNFIKALEKLTQSVEFIRLNNAQPKNPKGKVNQQVVLDEMIREGLIQRFEYTHELAWNVMKDYTAYQGNATVGGSRDATREAFQLQLITDGNVWMDMIGSRNKTSHTYNEQTANEIYTKILTDYYPAFVAFQQIMEAKEKAAKSDLF